MSKQSKLSILDQISIPKPCHEVWSKMSGGEKSRHCDSCNHCVVNLSAYSKIHAAEILSKNSGEKLCVRYECDTAGAPRYKKSISIFSKIAACLSALYCILPSISIASADCATCDKTKPMEEERMVMGKMRVASTPIAGPRDGPVPTNMGLVALPTATPAPKQGEVVMGDVALPTNS